MIQLIAALSAVSVLVPAVSASTDSTAPQLNSACDLSDRHAIITNSCNYPVYLWSVIKGMGCPTDAMFTLQPGAVYHENLRNDSATTGISIKMSKTQQCGGSDIAQLEYFLNGAGAYAANYLDMSYIDCPGETCPTRQEGFHMVAGSQTGNQVASADNSICPVISCNSPASCAKWSYIQPDDPQTRSCALDASISLNLCVQGPASGSPSSSSPAPSKSAAAPSSAKATSASAYKAQAAAVTPVVELNDNVVKNVKTEVVYVTSYQTVNAKRHLHGHARRHARFHA